MTRFATAAIGLRLAVGGGRTGVMRLALVASGVGVGVSLLLGGLAVAPALEARDARDRGREPIFPLEATPPSGYLLWSMQFDRFRDHRVRRVEVAPVGDAAPVPPGVESLPRPGEIVASPALARLLSSDDAALLRPRFRGRVVGVIAKPGLLSPDELIAYVGVRRSEARLKRYFYPVTGFGRSQDAKIALAIRLLILVGVLGLLIPTLAFVAASTRVAAATRERRLAAIRLAGATPGQARVLASVESAVAAALGCALGVALFLAVRPIVARSGLAGHEWFLADLRPPLAQVVGTLVAVPLLAVAAGLVALRRVELSPLGIVRQGRVRRVRALRALPLALGLAGLAGAWLLRSALIRNEELATLWVGSAFTLVLVGLALATPWLSTLAAELVAGGTRGVGSLLAARRVVFEPTASGRLVSGVVLAVFTTTVAHAFLPPLVSAAADSSHDLSAAVRPGTILVGGGVDSRELESALRGVEGVRTVATLAAAGSVAASRLDAGGAMTGLWVGDCEALNGVVRHQLPSCDPRRAYVLLPERGAAPPLLERRTRLHLIFHAGGGERTAELRLPESLTPTTALTPLFANAPTPPLLLPRELLPAGIHPSVEHAFVATDGRANTVERVRNALAGAGVVAEVKTGSELVADETREIRQVVRLIDLGTLLALAIAAMGLVVTSIDSVSQNRRPLAVLAATGVPVSLLRRAVLIQTAIPLAAGLLISATTALAASLVFLALQTEPLTLPLRALGALSGIAAIAVLAVTALTLPALSRAIGPEALRAE